VLAGGGIEPTLSPGGGRIAFRRGESFDPRELWVANADGSQAHRLAAVDTCSTPTWSPGGMKIVVVDPTGARSAYGGYLHVVDVVSGRSKRLLRREVTCDRPRWSPDGRRVAVTVDLPDDIAPLIVTLHTPTQRVIKSARGGHPYAWSPTGRSLVVGGSEGGLMLVEARSGRVRRPTTAARYGYDITGAAWHPGRMRAGGLGGVAARFGTVASDSTASGNTLVTKHRLADIAADGTNIVLLYADIANCVESWNPVQKKLVRFDEDSCLGIDNQAVDTVAAAGARSAWIDSMETLHYDLSVLTATARVPSPSIVFSEQDALGQGGLAGTGKLLVYVRRRAHTSQIVRLGPPNRVLGTEPGTASLLDVAPDRIAVEASGQTKILDGAGSVLAHIPSTATAAEVDGDVVAILRGRNLHLYDIRSSNTVARLTLPAGGRLLGLARGVIAYGEPGRIVLMRFSDRRRAAFAVPPGPDVNARLTNAGLFYSFPAGSGTHVIFRPFATIDKSLG
jgi:dipeptidyl aminopeptidase/acylaminoacyl peptidase